MPQKPTGMRPAAELRARAEARVLQHRSRVPEGRAVPTQDETLRAIHELQVHQVELEMQNDELARVQADLEVAQAHYFDLYHLAPVGYCILSREGLILEANLTAVAMLDLALSTLVRKPIARFILEEDREVYYDHQKQLYATGRSAACELRMVKPDGTRFWVQLTSAPSAPVQAMGREPVCRVVMSDITERRALQHENGALRARLREPAGHPGRT